MIFYHVSCVGECWSVLCVTPDGWCVDRLRSEENEAHCCCGASD